MIAAMGCEDFKKSATAAKQASRDDDYWIIAAFCRE